MSKRTLAFAAMAACLFMGMLLGRMERVFHYKALQARASKVESDLRRQVAELEGKTLHGDGWNSGPKAQDAFTPPPVVPGTTLWAVSVACSKDGTEYMWMDLVQDAADADAAVKYELGKLMPDHRDKGNWFGLAIRVR